MTNKEKAKLALALSGGKDWKQMAIEEREKRRRARKLVNNKKKEVKNG